MHSVTFRLVVTDDEGREAVMRKMILVQRDPSLLPGFPAKVGTGVESAPKIADVDGDGVDDLVFINSDGVVRVTDHTLTDKPGFPVTFRLLDEFDPTHPDNHLDSPSASLGAATAHHAVIGSPAVGDLDGDGDVEIVIGTLNGDLWAWHHDGAVVDGFPFMLDLGLVEGLTDPENVWDYGFFGSPALGDVDGDGDLDIVIGAMDSRVYVVDEAGELLDGWPVELRSEFGPPDALQSRGERIISSPAVGDIDGDGFLEIAIGTNQKNAGTYGVGYVLSHDGQIEPGWPAQLFGAYTNALPYVGEGIPGSPSICDLDGDGTLEVAMHTVADPGLILNSDGTTWARMSTVASDFGFFSNSAETSFAYVFINSGSFGDFDGDGTKDYFIGAGGFAYANGLVQDGYRFDHDHLLSGWSGALQLATPIRYELHGESADFHVRGRSDGCYIVDHDDLSHEVAWLRDEESGSARIAINGLQRNVAYCVTQRAEVTVQLHGLSATFTNQLVITGSDLDGAGSGIVTAPMHGNLMAVLVAVGDQVSEGEGLAVMEAMKMEHKLTAGVSGTVTEIHAAEGDQVAAGTTLLVIEEAET